MNLLPYHPFFCEENIWRLCESNSIDAEQAYAVMISNRAKACPIYGSKSAGPGQPVFWDYHTVLLEVGRHPLIWDPECRTSPPIPAMAYLSLSFPIPLPDPYRPSFRLIPAETYRLELSSDRSHMRRQDGSWLAEPPPWPPIDNGTPSNLLDWIDMRRPNPGKIMDLNGLCRLIESDTIGGDR